MVGCLFLNDNHHPLESNFLDFRRYKIFYYCQNFCPSFSISHSLWLTDKTTSSFSSSLDKYHSGALWAPNLTLPMMQSLKVELGMPYCSAACLSDSPSWTTSYTLHTCSSQYCLLTGGLKGIVVNGSDHGCDIDADLNVLSQSRQLMSFG